MILPEESGERRAPSALCPVAGWRNLSFPAELGNSTLTWRPMPQSGRRMSPCESLPGPAEVSQRTLSQRTLVISVGVSIVLANGPFLLGSIGPTLLADQISGVRSSLRGLQLPRVGSRRQNSMGWGEHDDKTKISSWTTINSWQLNAVRISRKGMGDLGFGGIRDGGPGRHWSP